MFLHSGSESLHPGVGLLPVLLLPAPVLGGPGKTAFHLHTSIYTAQVLKVTVTFIVLNHSFYSLNTDLSISLYNDYYRSVVLKYT